MIWCTEIFKYPESIPFVVAMVWIGCMLFLAVLATVGFSFAKGRAQATELSGYLGGTALAITVLLGVMYFSACEALKNTGKKDVQTHQETQK